LESVPADIVLRWSIFIGLFIIAAMCVAAWFLSPKGENQV
jgi:V-type H+-transporting ATPase subunit e